MKSTVSFKKGTEKKSTDKKDAKKPPFFDKFKKKDDDKTKKKSKSIKENDSFASELGDQDAQKQKEALNVTTNPVAEGVRILTFEQFLNEAEDFQNMYAPAPTDSENEPAEEENHDDLPSAEGTEDGIEHEGDDEPETEDDWNIPDDNGTDLDSEPTAIDGSEGDSVSSDTDQLTSLNKQIADLLSSYKNGSLTIDSYKEKASPLLAQRKELQGKLDKAFNMSLTGEEHDDDTF